MLNVVFLGFFLVMRMLLSSSAVSSAGLFCVVVGWCVWHLVGGARVRLLLCLVVGVCIVGGWRVIPFV